MPKTEKEYLTTSETCRYLGICRQTLVKWGNQGILVPSHLIGKRKDRRYKKKTLDQFFKESIIK